MDNTLPSWYIPPSLWSIKFRHWLYKQCSNYFFPRTTVRFSLQRTADYFHVLLISRCATAIEGSTDQRIDLLVFITETSRWQVESDSEGTAIFCRTCLLANGHWWSADVSLHSWLSFFDGSWCLDISLTKVPSGFWLGWDIHHTLESRLRRNSSGTAV